MNRQDAFTAMQNGAKITHRHFAPEEWYHLKDRKIIAEDGVNHTDIFWDKDFMNDGWGIFNEPAKQETHTNQLTPQIASAYWGAEVAQYIDDTKTTGVKGIIACVETDRVHIWMDNKTTSFAFYKDCQLLLTPLSAISDEDAIEVAKIAGYNTLNCPNLLKAGMLIVQNNSLMCRGMKSADWQQIIDYLRSKGYDTGYGNIKSLIEAGIALQKQ